VIARLHPHAISRLSERGATEKEAIDTVETGAPKDLVVEIFGDIVIV